MAINVSKFGTLMSYISTQSDKVFDVDECETIMKIIESMVADDLALVTQQAPFRASCADVDELMRCMFEGNGKIPPIKAYRTLTGAGLKEAKEAVERYYVEKAN